MSGRISFIGAGPGAADLITVRGARRITEADVVVWAASLVAPECIQEHARADAELIDSSRLTHEHAVEIYRRAERDQLKVARVHSGDPSLWGAVQEQYDVCARMDLEAEIVPGVPAFSAAAASVGKELTVPEIAQSVVLTRLEGGKTPMPDGEKVREFARHGTTMALFLSAARTGQLVTELRAGGYPDDMPVLIAYKVTWPDELMLHTTIGELETTVKQHKLWRHTLFIVGRALSEGGTRSRLYHPGHFHTYRKADPAARKALLAKAETQRDSTEEVPRPRGASSNSAVAWWAVRDWQETARNAPRSSHSRTSRVKDDAAQPDLFLAEQPGPSETEVSGAVPESDPAPGSGPAPASESDLTSAPETGPTPVAGSAPEGIPTSEAGPTPEPVPAQEALPEPESTPTQESGPKRASTANRTSRTAAKSKPAAKSTKAATKTNSAKAPGSKTAKAPSTKRKSAKRDDQAE